MRKGRVRLKRRTGYKAMHGEDRKGEGMRMMLKGNVRVSNGGKKAIGKR